MEFYLHTGSWPVGQAGKSWSGPKWKRRNWCWGSHGLVGSISDKRLTFHIYDVSCLFHTFEICVIVLSASSAISPSEDPSCPLSLSVQDILIFNLILGKHHYKKISVHLGIAQIAIRPTPPQQALAGSTISIPGFSGRDFVKIPGSRDFRDRD